MIAISCFAPFGGRPSNNSEKLLKEIKALISRIPETKLHFLNPLPVIFESCFIELEKQLNSLPTQPSILLAFGEAPTEKLKLETRASNIKHSEKPDEAGKTYTSQAIIKEALNSINDTIGFEKLYKELPPQVQSKFELSTDCGQFVCNNLSYHALHKLPHSIRFGFIHVSNSKEDLSADAHAILELIAQMKSC